MTGLPEVPPSTAAVRVRAFLEAADRARLLGDHVADSRNGRTIVSLAPTSTGAAAPLYLEDLAALVDDGRGDEFTVDDARREFVERYSRRMNRFSSVAPSPQIVAFGNPDVPNTRYHIQSLNVPDGDDTVFAEYEIGTGLHKVLEGSTDPWIEAFMNKNKRIETDESDKEADE